MRVTPIQTGIHAKNGVNEFDVHKITMPYSFQIDESSFNSVLFRFHCIINEDATKFSIKLLYGAREENDYIGSTLYGLDVDLNQNKVYAYSKMFNEMKGANNFTNIIFKKGKPFDCLIYVEESSLGSTITAMINNEFQQNYSIVSYLPQWMINSISMNGDIQLLDYKSVSASNTNSFLFKYKKQIEELKSNGTILCFEGTISSSSNMHVPGFNVTLLHNASEKNDNYGDVVLSLIFLFGHTEIEIGEDKTYFLKEQDSLLVLSSRKSNTSIQEQIIVAENPVQTGMEITLLIYANNDSYIISINKGDFFYYPHKIPSWTINHAIVDGYINNVYFDTEKCSRLANKLNLTEFQLPNNIFKVKPLENNEMIIIIGKIEEEDLIIVYLFNGAIKRHNECNKYILIH
ncbi:hypothetical protein Mgra_00008735 [Meloidogyne graminicola]|uniref:Galectin n=1 Tax=Meloidogyne graminicola TaxID=189291 RepID=A0A8S9ZF00_9BILA|nr:hypothetical protein Mgra_00008735 [Meloidogyne graminicola]